MSKIMIKYIDHTITVSNGKKTIVRQGIDVIKAINEFNKIVQHEQDGPKENKEI